jgi:hypothetical protein
MSGIVHLLRIDYRADVNEQTQNAKNPTVNRLMKRSREKQYSKKLAEQWLLGIQKKTGQC